MLVSKKGKGLPSQRMFCWSQAAMVGCNLEHVLFLEHDLQVLLVIDLLDHRDADTAQRRRFCRPSLMPSPVGIGRNIACSSDRQSNPAESYPESFAHNGMLPPDSATQAPARYAISASTGTAAANENRSRSREEATRFQQLGSSALAAPRQSSHGFTFPWIPYRQVLCLA